MKKDVCVKLDGVILEDCFAKIRRNFYEVYQTTPIKYLQILRINHAADLLVNSALSIEEISAMSGFSDSKYFCFVFKKIKACPPSVFRTTL